MERGIALIISIMVLIAFANTGAKAAHHQVGAPVPSPGIENSGVTVYASVVMAAMASLAASLAAQLNIIGFLSTVIVQPKIGRSTNKVF
ncbi:hypothetical protein ACH5RR_015507 [Cinchona calisaya]|uniref:Uncharacterized protein n=1 Tax=Cinchona calisaya TaxID=153742 RepID=A0ABD2ZTR2_9GENT